jgi:hypothetical protein
MFIQIIQIERSSDEISRNGKKTCTSDGSGKISSYIHAVVQSCDEHWDGDAFSVVGEETVVSERVESRAGRPHIPGT